MNVTLEELPPEKFREFFITKLEGKFNSKNPRDVRLLDLTVEAYRTGKLVVINVDGEYRPDFENSDTSWIATRAQMIHLEEDMREAEEDERRRGFSVAG